MRARLPATAVALALALGGLAGCSEDAVDDGTRATEAAGQDDGAADDEATPAGDDGAAADDEDGAASSVPPLLDVVDDWPETTVTVETDPPLTFEVKVADRDERRRQGLMQVPELPEDVGMLFTFDELRSGGFWMKDTLVPLDIAYIAEGEVVAVLEMAPCEADPCEVYDPGEPYDAALEVNQGALTDAEVAPGTEVAWDEPREITGS